MNRRVLIAICWLLSVLAAFQLGRLQPPDPVGAVAGRSADTAVGDGPAGSAPLPASPSGAAGVMARDAHDEDSRAELLAEAEALARDGRVDEAIQLVDAYLALQRSSDALFVRADLLMMSGRLTAALEPLFQILDYPETPAVAERARSRLELIINTREQQLINANDTAGLVEFFALLAAREPAYDRHRLKLAGWLLRAGDLDAAEALARQLGLEGITERERDALEREIAFAQTSLPFERVGSAYMADVEVIPAGRAAARSLRLLVDTGATTTGLSSELLNELGARRLERRVRVNTANGVVEMETYRVSGLRVGELELGEIVVLALPSPPRGADGLLGMDVLDALPKPVGTPGKAR